ncbi:hypothetical protein ARMGADRAFT_1092253 [Armillaria gallica]|uniref:Aminoglycoside phosphotransferase domain-containing protein n=1 Tax=Armillaria gallica TaxID=47427 RepID=A0A2H3CW71_ARMGA|nr:hypothetical protein ARMGADRAFT_1092253 [Armillaria gallica]
MYCPLPLYALKGGQFSVVITTGIQNELDRLSQVWVADGSLLPHPEPTELAETENIVYTTLEALQGSEIPYYYGKHKFGMPNGESTHVILLEYIEGTMPVQLEDKYPSHASPQYKPAPKDSYTEWLEIAKELMSHFIFYPGFDFSDPEQYVPALRAHRNLKTQNITITSMTPRQVVYIDIRFSVLSVPQHQIDVHRNRYQSVALPTDCCRQHTKDVEQWSKKNPPSGLMYQSGCNSEYEHIFPVFFDYAA